MKSTIKVILTSLVLLLSFFVVDNNVYAASKSTKCVYKMDGMEKKVTFTVTPNGKGGLAIDDINFSDGGYKNEASVVSSTNFINNISKIVSCPSTLYAKIELGANYKSTYTLNFQKFDGDSVKVFSLVNSENNGQSLLDNNGITEINACEYTGKTFNGNVVTNIVVHVYSDGTLDIESSNSKYTVKLDSNISYNNFKNKEKCPELAANNCGIDGKGNGYCTLTTDAIRDDDLQSGTTVPDSEDLTSEFTCNYVGQISGKKIKISKFSTNWNVTYPDGRTQIFDTESVGRQNTMPSSNCEDVFYVITADALNNRQIRAVDANYKFADVAIAGYCRGYSNDVEQFCANGKCKISNPICGTETTSDGDGMGCPKELRPIVVFIKRVVINTLQIFVPIILIIMGTVDLIRAMMSNDDKGHKDSISKFIKRVLAAVLMFFIVTIVNVVMNMFTDTDVGKQNDWEACWYDVD